MRSWFKRFGPESRSLGDIRGKFLDMISDGRRAFELAAGVLLDDGAPEAISEELFSTDRRINRTEQEIRREIVVHGSVYGEATFPELLVMMSLVKDAERVGDYAKNIYDLAATRAALGPDAARLRDMRARIEGFLGRAHTVHEQQDATGARALLREAMALEDECDSAVSELLRATDRNGAAAVLAFRYFKRIASHVSNIATSLVVPLDKLDFFDEPKVS